MIISIASAYVMQRRETSSIALAYVMQRRETPSNRALKAWLAGRRGRRGVRRVKEYHSRPVRVHGVSAYSAHLCTATVWSTRRPVRGFRRRRILLAVAGVRDGRQQPNEPESCTFFQSFLFCTSTVLLPFQFFFPPLTKQSRVESEVRD